MPPAVTRIVVEAGGHRPERSEHRKAFAADRQQEALAYRDGLRRDPRYRDCEIVMYTREVD